MPVAPPRSALRLDLGLLRTSLATIAVRVAGAVFGLAVTVALSRLLGPSALGIYALIMTALVLLAVPVGAGWQRLLLRSASSAFRTGDWAEALGIERRSHTLALIVTAAALAVVMALRVAGIAFEAMALPMLICAGFVLMFDQLSALRTAVLRSCDRSAEGTFPEMVVRPLAQLVAIGLILLVHLRFRVEEAIYSLTAGAVLAFAVGSVLLKRARPMVAVELQRGADRSVWNRSAAILGANALMNILNSQITLLLAGLLATTHEAGLYRVGVQVSLVAALGYTALNMVSAQRFAYFAAAADVKDSSEAAHLFARLAFLFTLPFLLILVPFGKPLFAFAFGPAFTSASAVAVVLILGQLVNSGVGMAASLLITHGMERLLVRATLASLAVNVLLAIALVPSAGALGAAIASAASMVVLNLATWAIARRRTGIDTSVLGLAPRLP